MRQSYYTLTPAAVRAHAEVLCQQHLRLQGHGPKCTVGRLWAVLFYAACRISSYLRLIDPSKSKTLLPDSVPNMVRQEPTKSSHAGP